jgi:7,8-dihydroneopterin aldolase/epimerase/oxygenase
LYGSIGRRTLSIGKRPGVKYKCSGFVLFNVINTVYLVKISLHNLVFFGYHGVHKEEKVLGGEYEVNIDLFYKERQAVIDKLSDTVDYTALFELVKNRMQQPTPLLETIAMEMASGIKKKFPVTIEINIRIKKINPPITAFTGNVEVGYTQKYL